MNYKEFTIHTTVEAEELVADIFWQYTDYGVAVSSLKDVIELTEKRKHTFDYIDEGVLVGDEKVSLVKGYFPSNEAGEKIKLVFQDLENLKKNSKGFVELGSLEVVSREFDGDDWLDIWRKHFRALEFEKVVICPTWIDFETKKPMVLLDSNMAFGTGEHETTSMCVEHLQNYVSKDLTVIDVGTGSGILGLVSAKLGAKQVVMTDIDQVAVETAKKNVKLNCLENVCFVSRDNLVSGVEVVGDIVVANITADILAILSQTILSYLKRGGYLIMSGIINSKLNFVLETYFNIGFEEICVLEKGEWSSVVMRLK